MKLGTIKRISKEDLVKRGEVPDWIDPLLETLNNFIEKVTIALNGNLSFPDNVLCREVEQIFSTGVTYEINPKIEGRNSLRAYAVIPLSTLGAKVSTFVWDNVDSGNISVTFTFATAASSKCRILILLR